MGMMPLYLEPGERRLLNSLRTENGVTFAKNWNYKNALVLVEHKLVATEPYQQISGGFRMGVQITKEGQEYLDNYPKDWTQAGFDITDFGESWRDVVIALNLRYVGKTSDSFVWWSPRNLFFVTQNNPETGEYAGAGQRDPQTGFASYIGLEGEDFIVKMACDIVKTYAESYKDFNPVRRSFI